jgi:dUTP pyrophosphatase
MLGGKVSVKIKADSEEFIPKYKTEGAACADLFCNQESVRILPNRVVVIDCGFSMELPQGWEAVIRSRSGLSSKGLQVTNSPATIDSDYRGRIKVILNNSSKEIIDLHKGDRIAQISLKPVWFFDWESVDELSETERGENGFGSTGV